MEWATIEMEKNKQKGSGRSALSLISVPIVFFGAALTLYSINLIGNKKDKYDNLYSQALKLADTNKDEVTTLEEWIEVYEKLRLPLGTLHLTLSQLEEYVRSYEVKEDKH